MLERQTALPEGFHSIALQKYKEYLNQPRKSKKIIKIALNYGII